MPEPEKPKPPVVLWVLIGVVVVALIAAGVYLLTKPSAPPTTPDRTTISLTPSYAPTDTSTDTSTDTTGPNGDQQPWYRDASGQVTASADVDSSELLVGDCVLNVSDLGDSIDTLAVVPCTTPHEAEVYALGSDIINTKAERTKFCQGKFQPFVGSTWEQTGLDVTWIYDQTGSTTDVQCMVYQTGKLVTKSYKGSKM